MFVVAHNRLDLFSSFLLLRYTSAAVASRIEWVVDGKYQQSRKKTSNTIHDARPVPGHTEVRQRRNRASNAEGKE